MESHLSWRLRWAAAYLADRYYLNEHGETYSLEGYDLLDPYKSFSVDIALSFIAISRTRDAEPLKEVCRQLLFTTLCFIDDRMVVDQTLDDVDITVPWMLYEHYHRINEQGTSQQWMSEFARVTFLFIYGIKDQRPFVEDVGSYELGRGIVETLRQLSPVAERLGRIFGVDML
jgi:hypothetical protein